MVSISRIQKWGSRHPPARAPRRAPIPLPCLTRGCTPTHGAPFGLALGLDFLPWPQPALSVGRGSSLCAGLCSAPGRSTRQGRHRLGNGLGLKHCKVISQVCITTEHVSTLTRHVSRQAGSLRGGAPGRQRTRYRV